MGRVFPPEPDRSYLQAMESVEFYMSLIRTSLRLGTDDPDRRGFRAAVPYARHLYELIRIAAIAEERRNG